ncbi:MAG TPA: nucleoside kinase [Thermotogota bacterium]|nr:nucleoside kinase [Thermotogota bacterium]HPJ88702.1 nucleoside kinase [Thermotogota bacterium]HPR95949.1 nucleoside kinase [Thermotogota bacterium]
MNIEKKESLKSILENSGYKPVLPVLGARVNNRIRELSNEVYCDSEIEFIDITTSDGIRMMQRGLIFLLYLSAKMVFPEKKLKVLHSIGNGLYCELGDWVTSKDLIKIKNKMSELIELDLAFKKEKLDKREAIRQFNENGDFEKVRLFKFRKKSTVNVYRCGDLEYINYFYGYLPPSTGCLTPFDIEIYGQGFLLLTPTQDSPEKLPERNELPKFSQVFLQYQRWGEILNIETVGDLNQKIADGKIKEVILMAEALHAKKISKMAEEISKNLEKRIILIAGPSSSGKTSTAKRLSLQLMAEGLRPLTISLDDYFVDRENTPKDENGNYDFESIHALDLELFNQNLIQLLDGKAIIPPKFNFVNGKRFYNGREIKIGKDQPIIIEGIHGLNEKLTSRIPRSKKFKIYVSALTQLGIDDINRIPTTDTRLLRRIVRDNMSRGHSALKTIEMWPSVRRGETRNIFPFQEEADYMFSSALVYELAVLKMYAEQLLMQISDDDPQNTESKRLLKFLEYFMPVTNIEFIPRNSIIREFIGGSIFEY